MQGTAWVRMGVRALHLFLVASAAVNARPATADLILIRLDLEAAQGKFKQALPVAMKIRDTQGDWVAVEKSGAFTSEEFRILELQAGVRQIERLSPALRAVRVSDSGKLLPPQAARWAQRRVGADLLTPTVVGARLALVDEVAGSLDGLDQPELVQLRGEFSEEAPSLLPLLKGAGGVGVATELAVTLHPAGVLPLSVRRACEQNPDPRGLTVVAVPLSAPLDLLEPYLRKSGCLVVQASGQGTRTSASVLSVAAIGIADRVSMPGALTKDTTTLAAPGIEVEAGRGRTLSGSGLAAVEVAAFAAEVVATLRGMPKFESLNGLSRVQVVSDILRASTLVGSVHRVRAGFIASAWLSTGKFEVACTSSAVGTGNFSTQERLAQQRLAFAACPATTVDSKLWIDRAVQTGAPDMAWERIASDSASHQNIDAELATRTANAFGVTERELPLALAIRLASSASWDSGSQSDSKSASAAADFTWRAALHQMATSAEIDAIAAIVAKRVMPAGSVSTQRWMSLATEPVLKSNDPSQWQRLAELLESIAKRPEFAGLPTDVRAEVARAETRVFDSMDSHDLPLVSAPFEPMLMRASAAVGERLRASGPESVHALKLKYALTHPQECGLEPKLARDFAFRALHLVSTGRGYGENDADVAAFVLDRIRASEPLLDPVASNALRAGVEAVIESAGSDTFIEALMAQPTTLAWLTHPGDPWLRDETSTLLTRRLALSWIEGDARIETAASIVTALIDQSLMGHDRAWGEAEVSVPSHPALPSTRLTRGSAVTPIRVATEIPSAEKILERLVIRAAHERAKSPEILNTVLDQPRLVAALPRAGEWRSHLSEALEDAPKVGESLRVALERTLRTPERHGGAAFAAQDAAAPFVGYNPVSSSNFAAAGMAAFSADQKRIPASAACVRGPALGCRAVGERTQCCPTGIQPKRLKASCAGAVLYLGESCAIPGSSESGETWECR